MSNLYTINLKLDNKKCLVIGGGKVALRKVRSLLDCDAHVTVISPAYIEEFSNLKDHPKLILKKRLFKMSDLNSCFLVVAATDNDEVNSFIAKVCHNSNILVNVVDNPDESSFFVPSVLRRGDLSISISTNGKSPALAAKIKRDLSKEYGDEYIKYVDLLGKIRQEVLEKIDDPAKRREIFLKLIDSDLLDLIKKGEEVTIKERISQCLS